MAFFNYFSRFCRKQKWADTEIMLKRLSIIRSQKDFLIKNNTLNFVECDFKAVFDFLCYAKKQ